MAEHANERVTSRPGARMLPADALFWYAEEATPELRPLVGALLLLDRTPRRDRLRASIDRLIRRVPRLRQRVEKPWMGIGPPAWEKQRNFERDYHLRDVVLPAPGSLRHVLDFTAALFESPLDHLRPLWEIYLIEGLAEGRAALFFKAHHSIVDGVGSLALFEAMTEPGRKPSNGRRATTKRPGRNAARSSKRDERLNGAGNAVDLAARMFSDPWSAVEDLSRIARALNGMVGDLRATQPIADPMVRDSDGIGRHLDCVRLPLPEVQRIKSALGVSLNDVVLTVVAGAIGGYHDRHRKHVEQLHCMVPMNLRQDHERKLLGNRVGVFNVTLPVGQRSTLLRLAQIHAQTSAAKGDRRGSAIPFFMGMASLMPRVAFRALAQQAVGRFHLICTNIPGPSSRRYLAGARVESIYPFAPLMLGAPLSFALLSYGDTLAVGIDADPAALPCPEQLGDHMREAVAELSSLTQHAQPASNSRRKGPKRKSRSTTGRAKRAAS